MKKLNLIIKSCDECPYKYYDEEMGDDFCPTIGQIADIYKLPNDCPLEDVTIIDNVPIIEGMRSLTKEESEAYRKFLETQFKPTGNCFMPHDMSDVKLTQDTEILLMMEEQETEQ